MKTVAVLRGGVGDEYAISLKTGATVLRHLQPVYKTVDVYIDPRGVWHMRGVPVSPERALGSVDVVFNALHGRYGEDGEVQRLLDSFGISYTGSGALASAFGINKVLAKEIVQKSDIRTPLSRKISVSLHLEDEIQEVFRSFPQPSIIKPADSGSSVGVTLAKSFDEFKNGIKKAFQYSKDVLVEQYIRGKEATVGVVDWLRNSPRSALPPVEIIPRPGSDFFDFDAKYRGESLERCPGNFSKNEIEALKDASLRVHEKLGLRHYSRSDFIVAKDGVYFLEVNTLPGLTEHSLFPKALKAIGVPLGEFIPHIVDLALQKK